MCRVFALAAKESWLCEPKSAALRATIVCICKHIICRVLSEEPLNTI